MRDIEAKYNTESGDLRAFDKRLFASFKENNQPTLVRDANGKYSVVSEQAEEQREGDLVSEIGGGLENASNASDSTEYADAIAPSTAYPPQPIDFTFVPRAKAEATEEEEDDEEEEDEEEEEKASTRSYASSVAAPVPVPKATAKPDAFDWLGPSKPVTFPKVKRIRKASAPPPPYIGPPVTPMGPPTFYIPPLPAALPTSIPVTSATMPAPPPPLVLNTDDPFIKMLKIAAGVIARNTHELFLSSPPAQYDSYEDYEKYLTPMAYAAVSMLNRAIIILRGPLFPKVNLDIVIQNYWRRKLCFECSGELMGQYIRRIGASSLTRTHLTYIQLDDVIRLQKLAEETLRYYVLNFWS